MKRKIFLCSFFILCLSGFLFAQKGTNPVNLAKAKKVPAMAKMKQRNVIVPPPPLDEKMAKRKKIIHSIDTLTVSDYMISIERVNDLLNSIRDSAQLDFGTVHMEKDANEISKEIKIIKKNIKAKHSAINIKNLYLYQSFTNELDEKNTHIKNDIEIIYNRAYHAKIRLRSVFNDSVFQHACSQKNIPDEIDKGIVHMAKRWKRTDSIVRSTIDTLNAIRLVTADNSMYTESMVNAIENRINKAKPQMFGPETSYLWDIQKADTIARDTTMTQNVWNSEHSAMNYYMSQTSGRRTFLFAMSALLFIWLFTKRKLLKKLKRDKDHFSFMNLHYLNHHPVYSFMTCLFCLIPFFDAYAPTSYLTIIYSFSLATASIILIKKQDNLYRNEWISLLALFVVNMVTYLLIEPTFITRLWMLVVHIAMAAFIFHFLKLLKEKDMPYYKGIHTATIISLILAILAIIANLFGRFSLSGLLGVASIFAVTQAFILPIFIDTFMELILLQLLSGRLKKGMNNSFNSTIVVNKIKKPVVIIAVLLWFVMLASNLNIYHDLYNSISDFLTQGRTIGSISFKLISVILFFVIIWIAHILQKLVSFLFGETGNELEDMTNVSKGQHSRLLISRLLVLLGGYLLAIMASGLPLDKLTIILGALGVGIGMGLQNVVNNFVSGIILIFDGSLQIGDYIEVNGQAGKVKKIGLRASTLNTADGAEVMIPNGNILSQNIVNWTYSNDQKRAIITFSLWGKELDANMINEIINSTIADIPNVIAKRSPIILYTKVTLSSITLNVSFWSTINDLDQVKSKALLNLNKAFAAKKIEFF